MAEEKEGPKPLDFDIVEILFILIFITAILGMIFMRIEGFLLSQNGFAFFLNTLWLFIQGKATFSELLGLSGNAGLATTIFFLKLCAYVLSVFLVWAILSTSRKLAATYAQLMAPLKPPKEIKYGVEAPATFVNPRWARVLEHVNSPNASDWRLAILEADIMLGDMLDKLGYPGATIGDKLKSVEERDFASLNDAWEAHKVRNAIAHEGSDLVMNKPEAERVVRLFEKVFKEFKYV